MATVTGFTATRMQAIEDSAIIDGDVIGGNLILTRHDGATVNAGSVIGPTGPTGPTGATSIAICTSGTRPTGGSLFAGLGIFETDTKRFYIYDGAAWVYRGGLWICTSSTRPASPFAGLEIFETDTKRKYVWDGTRWLWIAGVSNPTAARAYATGTTALVAGANTKINLAGESFDIGNNWAAHRYVVPEQRAYDVRCGVRVNTAGGIVAGDTLQALIMWNGLVAASGSISQAQGTKDLDSVASDIIEGVPGDICELWAFSNRALVTSAIWQDTFMSIRGI